MLLNYIKIAYRNLIRQKVYSIINILGLAIGLAAVVLIFLSIDLEYSYDDFHVNGDRIFRVAFKSYRNEVMSGEEYFFFAGTGPEIKNDIPGIEEYARISDGRTFYLIHDDGAFEIDDIVYTESNFFTLFDFNLILGAPDSSLTSPSSIVLTQETAIKLFGDDNPMGKIIHDNNHRPLTVTGVVENPPANSNIQFNALISFSTLSGDPDNNIGWNGATRYETYIMLRKNVLPSDIEANLPAFSAKINQLVSKLNVSWQVYLQPLKKLHLHYNNDSLILRLALYAFATLAVFILLTACINFINLTTAISAKRGKEIGIRKMLGAGKKALILQLLSESVLMSVIALVFALAFVELAMPKYVALVGKQLSIIRLFDPSRFPVLLLTIIITGVIAGLYPACRLSAFQPIKALKGDTAGGRSKVALRNVLVIFQFTISIALISTTFLVQAQLSYMKEHDLGFRKENTMVLELKNTNMQAHAAEIKNEIKKIQGVIGAAASSQAPSGGFWYNGCLPEGMDAYIFTAQVEIDEDYLELYSLEISRGRNFDEAIPTDTDKYMINEAFARHAGWENPIGKTILRGGNRHEVIGVVRDFNFAPLYADVSPLIIMRQPESGKYHAISIKITGEDIDNTLKGIERVWNDFEPDIPFEYLFLDDAFNQIYVHIIKFREIFTYFSGFAIFIAILGLFGLAAYTVEQRTKEIGVRKVLGASFLSITELLAKGFLMPVIIAIAIATPATFCAMAKLLENFPYRIDIGPLYFIIASAMALCVALMTVGYHAVKASLTDPVKALRYE
jgi:putative ABC transport system permease protein